MQLQCIDNFGEICPLIGDYLNILFACTIDAYVNLKVFVNRQDTPSHSVAKTPTVHLYLKTLAASVMCPAISTMTAVKTSTVHAHTKNFASSTVSSCMNCNATTYTVVLASFPGHPHLFNVAHRKGRGPSIRLHVIGRLL